jgi:hypothetical protein
MRDRRLPAVLAAAAVLLLILPLRPAAGEAEPPAPVAEERQVRALGLADLKRVDSALAADPGSRDLRRDRLRILYVLAVKEEALRAEGEAFLATLPYALDLTAGDPLLQAYRGAFRVLGAKHDLWPPRKLEHLKAGIPALDSAVAARPDQAEIRYLRLVSCYYLPFFIGRKDSVKSDFAALARLLPEAHADYPARWYLGFARFVLEKGGLPESERARVAEGMRRAAARGEGT